MARKGRKRRYQEARELKHSFDDGLFPEGDGTLADSDRGDLDEVHDPAQRGKLAFPNRMGDSTVPPGDGT
jgi:hypothetical protein